MKFIAKLRVWGNWGIGENVLKVFLRLRGSANRRVDLFLPLIASISGWRHILRPSSQATGPCDGTTARRWLCLRTGSGITEARPHPRALSPPRTTWAKWTSRVYFVPQSKWPLPRSLRASEPVDPRERGGNDGAVSEQSQLCGCLSLSD